VKVGFTGTRRGMTLAQQKAVASLVDKTKPKLALHGDCVGADADFHQICFRKCPIQIYPSNIPKQRAFCAGAERVFSPEDPLMRNRSIVDRADFVIATPGEAYEVLRSGTWSTIRYARKRGKRLYVVFPDGTVERS